MGRPMGAKNKKTKNDGAKERLEALKRRIETDTPAEVALEKCSCTCSDNKLLKELEDIKFLLFANSGIVAKNQYKRYLEERDGK